jgi:hypothetical protein
MDLQHYRRVLERAGVVFESGLSQAEIQKLEGQYGFVFPPDLKELLMFALPVSQGFLNWRHATNEEIGHILIWPYEGMCFDIEQNSFWLEEWGQQPASLDQAFSIARKAIEQAPTLIPIYGHRFIPDRPNEAGNPIFSVYQTDIIYYGCDLADYLENEFRYYFGRSEYGLKGRIKQIEFWSQFAEDAV